MTPEQLRQFRKRLGMSQAKFADCISVAPNTVARWERGELGMRPSTEQLIRSLMQHVDLTWPTLKTPTTEPTTEPKTKRRQ